MTPVRLEPAALGSRVKHSTTEPLRSQSNNDTYIQKILLVSFQGQVINVVEMEVGHTAPATTIDIAGRTAYDASLTSGL